MTTPAGEPDRRASDSGNWGRSPVDGDDGAGDCPLCGACLVALQCKLLCENCGYREDCSDLFPVRRVEPRR
jgi:hypothetical protein